MASTYLTRTPSTAGNRRTGTFSAWVKRGSLGTLNSLLDCYTSFELTWFNIRFSATDQIQAIAYDATSGFQEQFELRPTRLFRDTSAWYHIVFSWDSTQATASDRVKFYVNGVRETSFSSASYPALDEDFYINYNSIPYWIGRGGWNSNYFNGSMSYVAFVDGTAELPTIFGETDSVTGQWKIKTDITPSVAWGTNGFLILKNGNSLTDESTNTNNFTLGSGTLTNTLDCPSNVFATLNPLANVIAPVTLSEGNLKIAMTNSKGGNLSTISCTGGKYYAEMKITTAPQDFRFHWGIMPHPVIAADDPINAANAGIMLSGYNAVIYAANGIINNFYGNATGRFSGNPIMGLAIDLESATRTMAISINGAWVTGSNTTDTDFSNALKVDITSYVASYPNWFIGCGSGNGSGTTGVYELNFGNGYFGTTAVSSAGTPGSTPGTFEYDVPSGYEPLTTKGLNA